MKRLAVLIGLLLPLIDAAPARTYIGGPPLSLGIMCSWSTHVMIARVEKLDRERNVIIYRKIRDVKGRWPTDVMRHAFNPGLPNSRYVLDWAEPGKTVVMCALESYKWSHTYIDGEWYASNTPDWNNWSVSHSEPLLLRMYAGKADRLADVVAHICAGREVVVPGMVDGPLEDLLKRRGKFQRLKASLKLNDYNPKRDFVGWGNDDFMPLAGMPGFHQFVQLGNLGTEVQGIVSADFDGDAKPDLCLIGSHKVGIFLNGEDYFHEISLLGLAGGCRSAAAADYNGDGKADLLLATIAGPRLFTSLGDGNFRDDTALLPREHFYTLTAAAWLDYDADGRPDILLANGYHGLRLYRNRSVPGFLGLPTKPAPLKARPAPSFENRSDMVSLAFDGLGIDRKGNSLVVCDVDGDGFPDFLHGDGTIFLNAPHGFMPLVGRGLTFNGTKSAPAFGDFNGDGIPDLFVAQANACKLFQGLGNARFKDVTPETGDLSLSIPWASSAAWGDFDNDGRPDLVVGCLKGPNRIFFNKEDGTFEEGTDRTGLGRKVFNTQAVCLLDLNGDGALDMVFNNERQDAVALLGKPQPSGKRLPVTLFIAGGDGVVGSRVRVMDEKRRCIQSQVIVAGSGRNPAPPQARFALEPGSYEVEVSYSSGLVRARQITVIDTPLRGTIDERTPRLVKAATTKKDAVD